MQEEGAMSWEMPLNILDGKIGDKSQRRKGSKKTLTSMSVQKHPEKSVPIWGDFSEFSASSFADGV